MQEISGDARWLTLRGKSMEPKGVEWSFFKGDKEAPKKAIEKHPEKYMGYLTRRDAPQGFWLCKAGHSLHGAGGEWTAHLYRTVGLPTDQLFEDEHTARLTKKKMMRPGRGEGLMDEVSALSLFCDISPGDLRQGGLGDCVCPSAARTP